MALQPGHRLGSYVIEGPLGTGGMAEVYRANHRTLDRAVALKVINPQFNADPTFSLRFLREAKAVARLNHPNIITIYDFDEQGELAYLVMELAPNGTLRDQARGFRTLSEAVVGLAPIGAALQYAHERGIVHRDVKPINVLINEQGRPLLADFGLARVATESLDLWTFAGTSAGSPHYMPPEQALGKEIDHRADIYALGIVTYQIVTGRLPYHGESPLAIMQQHITMPPPSVRALLPDAPATLEAAILRATAKEPADRYDSAAAFLADLHRAAAEHPGLPIGTQRAQAAADPSPAPRNGYGGAQATRPPGTAVPDPDGPTVIVPAVGGVSGAASQPADATALLQAMRPPGVAVPIDTAPTMIVPPPAPAAPAMVIPPNLLGLPRPRRRPTGLTPLQWVVIGGTVVALLFIIAVNLWQTRAHTAAGGLAGAVQLHHVAIRKALAVLALLLAALNVTLMRAAIVEDYHVTRAVYRRLRQNHRFVGYTSAAIAISVQALAWIGIAGAGSLTGGMLLFIAVGAVLLVAAVCKVGIVRFVPSLRRYLPRVGWALLVLYTLVLIANLVLTIP